MAEVTMSVSDANVAQVAYLARLLAESGEQLTPTSPGVVDIASSGGPGSLSTLLAPLYACALGGRVAKIGVPGRPAGGLDTLASLPGYRVDLDEQAARKVLDTCGYVHVAAGRVFCPLDARFFAWRQANGAQAIPNLAIASLLAKKLSAGVGRVVLDIRVGPYGNLGFTMDEARPHADRFIAVAAELGIQAICVLSDFEGAPQPWIGRGEALVALASLCGDAAFNPNDALNWHANACLRMALIATDVDDPQDLGALAESVRAIHEAMLIAHGSDPEAFWSRQRAVAAAERKGIFAEQGGTLYVELGGIRRVLVELQRSSEPTAGARFSDPGGLQLTVDHGSSVSRGSLLASVRDEHDSSRLAEQLAGHLRVLADLTPRDTIRSLSEIIRG